MVCILAGVVGLKNRFSGAIAGCILTIFLYFYFYPFVLTSFFFSLVAGFIASFFSAYFIPWFFSGFKGGKRHAGPSIIGGFGKGRTAHQGGGIILSDEEREGIKRIKEEDDLLP